MLNFWSSTCPPCRREAPELSRLHRTLEGRGRVIGVSTDARSVTGAGSVAKRLGMRYPIAVLDGGLQETFAVTVLPTTYLLDDTGKVRGSFVGAVTEAEMLEAIGALGR